MQNVVPARWSAVRAGLGKFRNNNFLYTDHGSWNWIDTWVVVSLASHLVVILLPSIEVTTINVTALFFVEMVLYLA